MRNICIDSTRRRRIETVPIDEQHDTTYEENTHDKCEELYIEVKSIIDRELTPQQKRILELKDIEGYSIEEIAEMLEANENAIRMNLSRARKKIRECYRKEAINE